MRCIIAGYPFHLTASEVEQAMHGVKPEPIAEEFARIGRNNYPVRQIGAVVTGQDRRDFTSGEVVRALTKLGFTCHPAPTPAPPTEPETFRF
ncbi:SCO5918 family protein [Streptomyces sp. URMC 123]|uniref:SCO5918 family protein n=1 Tax=Streptomyces sp. URMC 123 TaxID=3423403 RepID=UPI003F198031